MISHGEFPQLRGVNALAWLMFWLIIVKVLATLLGVAFIAAAISAA